MCKVFNFLPFVLYAWMCMYVVTCALTCIWRSEGNSWDLVLSFGCVGPWDQTQASGLATNDFLTSPRFPFLSCDLHMCKNSFNLPHPTPQYLLDSHAVALLRVQFVPSFTVPMENHGQNAAEGNVQLSGPYRHIAFPTDCPTAASLCSLWVLRLWDFFFVLSVCFADPVDSS